MRANEKTWVALADPENVEHLGHEYGGKLKLHHRDRSGEFEPGEHLVIKWPSYTQWSGRGHREANQTEYWLIRVVEGESKNRRFIPVVCLDAIIPGRQRSLVAGLVDRCKDLNRTGGMDSDELDELHEEVSRLRAEVTRLRGEIIECSHHHTQPWQLPDWCRTKEDLGQATDEQLEDVMGLCHVEDGDPNGSCLACYAYGVLLSRE